MKTKLCTKVKVSPDYDYCNYECKKTEQETSIEIQRKEEFISTPLKFRSRVRIVTKLSSPFYKDESITGCQDPEINVEDFKPRLYSTAIRPSKQKSLKRTSSAVKSNEQFIQKANDNDYVCCISYKATLEGDLSINFAERVKLICYNNDFALVESNNCHGFVPKYCIIPLDQFLNDNNY